MSTTIVFACKSNSCRSQMAEGWARKWIAAQRHALSTKTHDDQYQEKLRAFLDGLLVLSVALDESSVGTPMPSPPLSSERTQCVTCDGDQSGVCTISLRRRQPKEKAILAMARDGVDITNYYAKTVHDILPTIEANQQQLNSDRHFQQWEGRPWFAGLRRVLETASREMGMAYAGVARDDRCVDKLIVLCSCPASLKQPVSLLAKETAEWDITPPSAAARAEGDGAYLRVSRQIKEKVGEFMDELKERSAPMVDGQSGMNRLSGDARLALPVPA